MHNRKEIDFISAQMSNERSTFMSHYRELSDNILPRRARFITSDSNKGDLRNNKIIDSTATLATRTLRSGMMSGVTSPARPWFRLSVPGKGLSEIASVKNWLHQVGEKMTDVFIRSNLYNVLPIIYGDIGVFATGAMLMEEDFNSVVRFYPFPIGSYAISNNDKLQVDKFYREFRLKVSQIIEKFAEKDEAGKVLNWEIFSTQIKDLSEQGNSEAWIDICHMVLPNPHHDPNKLGHKFKKYSSYYWEKGSKNSVANDKDKYLSEKGYNYFPVLCPRWEISGEDDYGTDCPGMSALGDIKQLQLGEKRGAQAIEKMINPAMIGPTSLRNSKASILPGDITYVDSREGMQGFRPAHEVRFDINALEAKQAQVRDRIRRAFFEDLFLMLASSDRRQITAREIEERHEEKLLALGPVLEQLNQDLLDPLIDNTFAIMEEQGLIPEPPEELQGTDLKVEYISIMAQAQKLVGLGGIERFTGFVGQIGQINPESLDKLDTDQLIDIYGDLTSIPPGIVRSDEDVKNLRDGRAQQAQQAQQMEQAAQMSQAAQTLSKTDTGEGNALSDILAQSEEIDE